MALALLTKLANTAIRNFTKTAMALLQVAALLLASTSSSGNCYIILSAVVVKYFLSSATTRNVLR